MEPTYMDGEFNICFKPRYIFSGPKKKDIVAIRLAGNRVMLLKRVVALEDDTLEFKNGILYVNGEEMAEDYLVYPSNWNLAPRKVDKGKIYVMGDNRNVPIQVHEFGQASKKRIIGGPLW